MSEDRSQREEQVRRTPLESPDRGSLATSRRAAGNDADELLLVAIDHTPQSGALIRAARRRTAGTGAPWICLAIEDTGYSRLAKSDRERLSEHIAMAQRLGAETLVVSGPDVAAEILEVARARRVVCILVGKPTSPRWLRYFQKSVVSELVRRSGDIEILVSGGDPAPDDDLPRPRRTLPRRAREYAWIPAPIVAGTAICLATRDVFSLADQAMIYLLCVLVAASRLSRLPSLISAVLSIAAFDFFFVPPFYTFSVEHVRHGVTFFVMLVVAVTVSRRTVLLREEAELARTRERRTAALFDMSRAFSAAVEAEQVGEAAVQHVRALFDCDAVMYATDGSARAVRRLAGDESGLFTTTPEHAVAHWVLENGRAAGFGTDMLPGSKALYLPLAGARGTIGVLGVALRARDREIAPSEQQLLETFAAQAAVALERVVFSKEAAESRLSAETERMRSSLLSSVSHDLRTPLASISGSAQVLLADENQLTPESRRELLETVREEGDRLSRLVGNLLDLTRFESGAVEVAKEWVPVDEIVHSAIGRLSTLLEDRTVDIALPADVLLVPVDPVLLEQALINLIENATKYSAPGTPLDVSVARAGDEVVFRVSDRGRGIPPGEEQRIFEKFYRIDRGGSSTGAGLGLAVAHAIVAAHKGTIRAENRTGGGATFTFQLPIEGSPPTLSDLES